MNILMSELTRIASYEVIGTGEEPYVQIVTEEITPEARKALLNYGAKEIPFKDGYKTRFWFPKGTTIEFDLIWEAEEEEE